MFGFSRDAQLKAMSTQASVIKQLCTLHDVMEITYGQPLQNSNQNSVFWR
jgi:hypothetical protein